MVVKLEDQNSCELVFVITSTKSDSVEFMSICMSYSIAESVGLLCTGAANSLSEVNRKIWRGCDPSSRLSRSLILTKRASCRKDLTGGT